MKGQRLLVREADPADSAAIAELLGSWSSRIGPTDPIWIGKLVGEVVAALAVRTAGDGSISVVLIYVAPDLRRKRIGTYLLRSVVEKLESDGNAIRVTDDGDGTRAFFLKNGFVEEGEFLARRISFS